MVSVVIPCYNSAPFLFDAIQSVITQTYKDLEIIVVDDCSSDDTYDTAVEMAARHPRILVLRHDQNRGVAAARNTGIDAASGDILAFLDSDDLWLPRKLEIQLALLARHPKSPLLYSSYFRRVFGRKQGGKYIAVPAARSYHQLLRHNVVACSTAVVRRACIEDLHFPDVGHEDFALWLRILRSSHQVARGTTEPLAVYRVRANSVSSIPLRSARFTWNVYRKCEGKSLPITMANYLVYVISAGIKRLPWPKSTSSGAS